MYKKKDFYLLTKVTKFFIDDTLSCVKRFIMSFYDDENIAKKMLLKTIMMGNELHLLNTKTYRESKFNRRIDDYKIIKITTNMPTNKEFATNKHYVFYHNSYKEDDEYYIGSDYMNLTEILRMYINYTNHRDSFFIVPYNFNLDFIKKFFNKIQPVVLVPAVTHKGVTHKGYFYYYRCLSYIIIENEFPLIIRNNIFSIDLKIRRCYEIVCRQINCLDDYLEKGVVIYEDDAI